MFELNWSGGLVQRPGRAGARAARRRCEVRPARPVRASTCRTADCRSSTSRSVHGGRRLDVPEVTSSPASSARASSGWRCTATCSCSSAAARTADSCSPPAASTRVPAAGRACPRCGARHCRCDRHARAALRGRTSRSPPTSAQFGAAGRAHAPRSPTAASTAGSASTPSSSGPRGSASRSASPPASRSRCSARRSLGVRLEGLLEGPSPWHVRAHGEVEVLFVSCRSPSTRPSATSRRPSRSCSTCAGELSDELAKPGSWAMAATARATVTACCSPTGPRRTSAPVGCCTRHGSLTVRQKLLPLRPDDRPIRWARRADAAVDRVGRDAARRRGAGAADGGALTTSSPTARSAR